MAKKNRRGVRTYNPRGFGVLIYAIFALAVAAGIAGFAMLTMFTYKNGSNTITFTGLDFFFYTIRQFFANFAQPKFSEFSAYFDYASSSGNGLLKTIGNIHGYIELGLGGFIGLTALFAAFEVLAVLLTIIFGSRHPKTLKAFAWLTFWFFAITIGVSFMYFFFYKEIIKATGVEVSIDISLEVFMILGAMFVLCILMAIVYRIKFKDRVAFKKKKDKGDQVFEIADESENNQVVINSPTPQPQINVQTVEEQTAPKANDVITVGDRAYAKNMEIVSVDIPEGIVSLGSFAFSNCKNLQAVNIPSTMKEIGFNCFVNTPKLKEIVYNGTVEQWKLVKRGNDWLLKSGTTIVKCKDGQVNVNPRH